MSRAKKSTKDRRRRQREKEASRAQQLEDVIADTAATFTCAAKTGSDFFNTCDRRLEAVDFDLTYGELANDIWRGRQGPERAIADALGEFVAELHRHMRALEAFAARFRDIADDEGMHIHLEPIETYRGIVRAHLAPPTDPPTGLA